MRIFSFIILLLSATMSIFLSSCREEIDIDVTDTIEDLPVELISTHIYGQVLDINNNAISNATIKIQNNETVTDENGYFNFDSIYADRNGTNIIAQKQGYFQNVITVYPKLNHSLFSTILMIEKNNSTTMLSYEGGSIPVSSVATINFEANTLVYDDDGSNFEGNAHVEFEFLDKNTLENLAFFPGEKIGVSVNNEFKGMSPYALILLDITDGKTKKLRLAKGQSVEVVFHLEDEANPPGESINTWYLSTNTYRWQSKGKAQNINGEFVAIVNDFEFFAIANPFDVVTMKGNLKYPDGIKADRHTITVVDQTQLAKNELYSDNYGDYKGFVPKNVDLFIEIRNECGKLVLESEHNALSGDEVISFDLTLDDNCRNILVSGQLIDCYGEGVANAYVNISTSEQSIFFNSNDSGYYQGYLKACDAKKMSIVSGDLKNNLSSAVHENLLMADEIKIGDWRLCEVPTGKISVHFNDRYFFLTDNLQFEESGGGLLMEGESSDHFFDCDIAYFKGVGEYHIGDIVPEFIPSFQTKELDGITLKPKDENSLDTWVLTIEDYIENERIIGHMEGLAKDENNNNIEGMMYLKFDIPIKN